jgi:hypothetical protein
LAAFRPSSLVHHALGVKLATLTEGFLGGEFGSIGKAMPLNLRHRNFLKELDFTGRLHAIKAVMVATLGR